MDGKGWGNEKRCHQWRRWSVWNVDVRDKVGEKETVEGTIKI